MTKHAFGVPSVALSLVGGVVAVVALASLAPDSGVAGGVNKRAGAHTQQAVLPTRIEVDNQTNAIRFYVNGARVATLDSLGLQQAAPE